MKIVKSVMMAATALSVVVVGGVSEAAPLAGYWKLNETLTSQRAVDSSGNILSGTYNAAVDPTVAGPNAGFGTGSPVPCGCGRREYRRWIGNSISRTTFP